MSLQFTVLLIRYRLQLFGTAIITGDANGNITYPPNYQFRQSPPIQSGKVNPGEAGREDALGQKTTWMIWVNKMVEHPENKQKQHDKKTRKISLRLTESEYAQISDEMTVCGLSVSSLTRKHVLGVRVASHADLAVLSELRRLCGLLKHIHNETRGAYSSLTAQAIKDLSAYARALTEKTQNTEKRRAVSPEESTP